MRELPYAEVYEKEFKYWPWGKLIRSVKELLIKNSPKNAKILDLCCGPGYLLGKLYEERPDLNLLGVDISKNFISYAKRKYQKINFVEDDVLNWNSGNKYDVIICTAGLHHLPYEKQEQLVKKACDKLDDEGFCIFADPCIGNYDNEMQRILNAAELGYKSLIAVVKNEWGPDMMKSAIDVMYNDIMKYEFKTSMQKLKRLYLKFFSKVEIHKTWPKENCEYGDYYFILKE